MQFCQSYSSILASVFDNSGGIQLEFQPFLNWHVSGIIFNKSEAYFYEDKHCVHLFQCDSPGLPAAKKSKTQAEDSGDKVTNLLFCFLAKFLDWRKNLLICYQCIVNMILLTPTCHTMPRPEVSASLCQWLRAQVWSVWVCAFQSWAQLPAENHLPGLVVANFTDHQTPWQYHVLRLGC